MNNLLLAWAKIEEAFWNAMDFSEDVRKEVGQKLDKVKRIAGKLAIAEIVMIVIMIMAIAFKTPIVAMAAAIGSAITLGLSFVLSSAVKELIVLIIKLMSKSGDKKTDKEREEGIEKLELNLRKILNTLNHFAMAIVVVTTWALTFSFGNDPLMTLGMVGMIVTFFTLLGYFSKKENLWPRKVMTVAMSLCIVVWFSTLDTIPSRALSVRMQNIGIGTEKNTDSKATAVIISDAILYHVDEDGDLVEWTNYPGAKLVIGSVVRIKETRRFDDELFTKVVIPNANGSYARGTKAYIQTEVLSSSKGLTVYPNATNPQYAISKEKSGSLILGGKEVWKIYFLTNEPIDISTPVGKCYTLSGINSGELWAMNTRPDNPQAGKMGNDLKVGVKYHNPDARSILAAPKGTVLIITWTNG